MKIEIEKESNLLGDLFAAPLSAEGEAEYLKIRFAEDLLKLMKEQGVSRSELAQRMEIQPSRVTSMLRGTNNSTIDTMARAVAAVGGRIHQTVVSEKSNVRWQVWQKSEVHSAFQAKVEPVAHKKVTFKLEGQSLEDAGAAA